MSKIPRLKRKTYNKSTEKALRKIQKEVKLSTQSKKILERYGKYLLGYYNKIPIGAFNEGEDE
jgi:hypothetical protein